MALVPAVLESAFAAIPPTTDPVAAADRFALAYQTYAAAAQAGPTIPIFTGLEQAAFSAALQPVFQIAVGSAAGAAAAFVQAVTTFWMTPPVSFGTNPPPVPLGVVTAFTGAAVLQVALVALFGAMNDTATFAAGLAAALDVATRTVVVTITAGPTNVNLS
jgi:hypothetical protein